jgi:hypothetical protein
MRPLRSPRRANHLASIAVALATVAALLLSGSAQAATVSQKIYKIFITEYRAEIAYSTSHVQANLTSAQKRLAKTASSIDALSSSNNSAATALVDELEHQYDVAGARGLFKASMTAFTALTKLPLTPTEHKAAVDGVTYIKRAIGINTPHDLSKWQAKSFATGSEPKNTAAFGGILGVALPSISLPVSASNSAIQTFVKLKNEAGNKITTVFNTLSKDWANWASGFGIAAG